MRNYFFEKGEEIKINSRIFILTTHRLDSHTYALERNESAPLNYVNEFYTPIQHKNCVQYITCWEDKQQVPIKPEFIEEQQKQLVKGTKKKSFTAFLTKKKNENMESKNQSPNLNIKKDNEVNQTNFKDMNVLYVQLQPFTSISIPNQIEKIKELFTIIYLLASSVKKQLGIYPQMIPVLNDRQAYKFMRKGKDLNSEIFNLFQYVMQDRTIQDWSTKVGVLYRKCKEDSIKEKPKTTQLLCKQILQNIQDEVLSREYNVQIKVNGKYIPDICKIVGPATIQLTNMDCELPLEEFTLNFHNKGEKVINVTYDHEIFEPISMNIEAEVAKFLISYLQQLKNY